MHPYCVYILASRSKRLYTGVTNDLPRRMMEHRAKRGSRFTSRYSLVHLVYYECGGDIRVAIRREKQIKGWSRSKTLALIALRNPEFRDLLGDESGFTLRDSSPLRGSE